MLPSRLGPPRLTRQVSAFPRRRVLACFQCIVNELAKFATLQMEQKRLAEQVEAEEQRVNELRQRVKDAQQLVQKLQKKQRTLEINMCRLYETAKQKSDERSQLLTEARLRAVIAPRNNPRPPSSTPESSGSGEKRQRTT